MPRRKPSLTAAQIKQHIAAIMKEIEKQRRLARGNAFTAVTPKEVERKLRRVNSPFIDWQTWSGNVPGGGTQSYTVGVYNPDPVAVKNLFVHVWVGSGNVDTVAGTFLMNVDPRFPRALMPAFDGFALGPGASTSVTVTFPVPTGLPTTNYPGNSCLWQANWHDTGRYLDRGVFVFAVP